MASNAPYAQLATHLVDAESLELIEIAGEGGTGKTTLVSQIITELVTRSPEPNSVVLFAGDREIDAARKRWENVPQVVVQGRLSPDKTTDAYSTHDGEWDDWFASISKDPDFDGHRLTVLFDDWFTESDGSLRLHEDWDAVRSDQDNPSARERTYVTDRIPFLRRARVRVIAAFLPGHTTQIATEDVPEEGGPFDGDEFTQTLHGPYPANTILSPIRGERYGWQIGVDVRTPGIVAPAVPVSEEEATVFESMTS